MWAEETGRVEIDLPTDDPGQLVLHVEESQPGLRTRLKDDKDIDVAVGGKVVAQNGTEQRQAPDAVSTTERRNLASIDLGPRRVHRPNHTQRAKETTVALPTIRNCPGTGETIGRVGIGEPHGGPQAIGTASPGRWFCRRLT